jgi:pimeloyl-ACP methyl ester carboxylesterase
MMGGDSEMTQTKTVETEGAGIVYDFEGQGPLLLLIAGGNGDGSRYVPLSRLLADEYTVVRYDRRANLRSGGDATADLDMAQMARDAAAVIRAMGAEDALVFGNSAGANIGIKLAEDHPRMVKGLVAHEPPIVSILPDADKELPFIDEVHAIFLSQGTGPAMRKFAQSMVGFDLPRQVPGDQGLNMDRFMAHEFVSISRYKPDLDTIRRNKVAVVAAAGRASADAYYARTARFMAERLGCPYVEMPGHHLTYVFDAATFAPALRDILHGLRGAK